MAIGNTLTLMTRGMLQPAAGVQIVAVHEIEIVHDDEHVVDLDDPTVAVLDE